MRRMRMGALLILVGMVLLSFIACSLLSPPPPEVPQPPEAAFEIRWLDNFTVELNAFNSSVAKGRHIESYHWDFGDGNQIADHLYLIQHRYEQPGRYLITLTVQDHQGLTASTQKDVVVVPEGEIHFEVLDLFNSRIQTQKGLVVRAQKELERLWQEALAIYAPLPNLPALDFEKEVVIAIFLGLRPHTGYGIRADRIRAEQGKLKVWYVEAQVGLNCGVGPAFTSPLLLLRAERVDLPALFSSRVEVIRC